ncbi:hypothetical protein GGX14DRAFT_400168 [Mycena pura]|uniref:Uncharacterized protein n=1 Tax=Mycena pura TaxID=153505 RepID=A0AAD6Y9X3_9AGAR|nr:hypothetical protein GGX14DRAFT_400168 [Mycena pura]
MCQPGGILILPLACQGLPASSRRFPPWTYLIIKLSINLNHTTYYYGKLEWNPTYLNSLLIAHHFPLTFAPPVVSNTSHIPRFALGSTILRTRDAFIKSFQCGDNLFNDSDPNYCPGFVWWPPGAMLSNPHHRPQVLCANTAIGCRWPGKSAYVTKYCKQCCLAGSLICSTPTHKNTVVTSPTPVTPSSSRSLTPLSSSDLLSPLNYAKAYAKNITPTYAHKLQINPSLETYTKKPLNNDHGLPFSVDLQNDEEPHKFNVPVPIFPLFHPQDDSAICAVVGRTTCANYSFYNGKKMGQHQFGSVGVTRCPGGPFAAKALETSCKRALSLTGSDTQSPTRIRLFDSISLSSLFVADGAIFRSTKDIDHESPVKKKELLSGSVIDLTSDNEESVSTSAETPKKPGLSDTHATWALADVLVVAVNLGREVGGEWAPLAQKYSKKTKHFLGGRALNPAPKSSSSAIQLLVQKVVTVNWPNVTDEDWTLPGKRDGQTGEDRVTYLPIAPDSPLSPTLDSDVGANVNEAGKKGCQDPVATVVYSEETPGMCDPKLPVPEFTISTLEEDPAEQDLVGAVHWSYCVPASTVNSISITK